MVVMVVGPEIDRTKRETSYVTFVSRDLEKKRLAIFGQISSQTKQKDFALLHYVLHFGRDGTRLSTTLGITALYYRNLGVLHADKRMLPFKPTRFMSLHLPFEMMALRRFCSAVLSNLGCDNSISLYATYIGE